MAYEQPRVPILRDGEKLTDFVKEIVRFLRAHTQAAWNADRLKDEKLKELEDRIKALEGG